MKKSKKSIFSIICLISTFVAGFLLRGLDIPTAVDIAPTIQAQVDKDGSRRCSNRTLKGAYGVKFEGQKLNEGPFVSVSRITFDGEGHFTTNEIGRFNGNAIQRTFTGPYTVNEDCTGFLDFSSTITNPPHEAHGNFIIVNEGRGFFIVDNEDGWAATGIGAKL